MNVRFPAIQNFVVLFAVFAMAASNALAQKTIAQDITPQKATTAKHQPSVAITDAAIISAFASTAQGHSSDELLINDKLRSDFLAAMGTGNSLSRAEQRDALLKLLRLRKAGKLKQRATKRGPQVDDSVTPIAEMAARVVIDRHQITTDTMLADPEHRAELQSEAEKVLPSVDAYSVRKSVLRLRKKRALKPELVLKVTDWGRKIVVLRLEELRAALESDSVAKTPGVYVFRNHEGYIYVGEADNLSKRLTQHVTASDRKLLAEYLAGDDADKVTVELHVFSADSPGKRLAQRRAYESELIRSRKPKFNERP